MRKIYNYLYALVSTLCIFVYINLNFFVRETGFDRSFNQLGKAGFSLSARINHFYLFYFFAFPVVFIILYFVFDSLMKKTDRLDNVMGEVAGIFLCTLPVYYLSEGNKSNIPLLVVILLIITAVFGRLTDYTLEKEDYYLISILSFIEWISWGKTIFWLYLLLWCAQGLLMYIVSAKNCKKIIYAISSGLVWLPAVMNIALEIQYVLIGKGKEITDVHRNVIIASFAWIAMSLLVGAIFAKKVNKAKIPYMGTITSIGMTFALPSFSTSFGVYSSAQLFEMGNTTSFVDTIRSGDILGANFFSAHMLSDSYLRYVYYFFNKDLYGAIHNNYGGLEFIIMMLLLFIILKNMIDENAALFICLFMPLCDMNCYTIDLSFLPVIALLLIISKNRAIDYFFYWFALAFGVYFQIDKGVGIGFGCIGVLLLLGVAKKVKIRLIPYLASMLSATACVMLVLVTGCVKDNISVVNRIKEFVAVTAKSNPVWAIESMGDASSLAYTIVYFILPVTTVCILIYMLLQIKNINDTNIYSYSLVICLVVAQLLFSSRTLVLYTLGNGVTPRFFAYFAWMLAFFVVFLLDKKDNCKAIGFAATLIIAVGLQCALVIGLDVNEQKIPVVKACNESNGKQYAYDEAYDGTKRTVLKEEGYYNTIEMLKFVFAACGVGENDTFIDFANVSGLYGLLEKERPFYVSQSPGLLTDELTQRLYIEEIEKNGNAKLAFLPAAKGTFLDGMIGIRHSQRYFLVAEYLYQNYRPLIQIGELAVWGRNDEYDTMKAYLESYGCTILDDIYGDVNDLHTYDYGAYAWAWANRDLKDAVYQPVVYEVKKASNEEYIVDTHAIDKSKGNYLMITIDGIEGAQVTDIRMLDNAGINYAEYSFTTYEGVNKYLIRCSNDYSWYTDKTGIIRFDLPSGCKILDIKILQGD